MAEHASERHETLAPGFIAPSPIPTRSVPMPQRRYAAGLLVGLWQWFLARRLVTQAVLLWAASRLFIATVTAASLLTNHRPLSQFLSIWVQWDAGWYTSIAQHGYTGVQSAGFFPLYPYITHALWFALPGTPVAVPAMIVSSACALVAAIGVARLATYEYGSTRTGVAAVAVIFAYPVAYFLAAPYTEPLFLAGSVWALYFARRGCWWRVALCAFVAGMTRATAVALILPLVWEYGAQQKWWQPSAWLAGGWRERLQPRVLAMGIVAGGGALLGLLVVAAIDWVQFGDPLLYAHAQSLYWHHPQWSLFQTLGAMATSLLHPPSLTVFKVLVPLDLGTFAGMIVLTLLWVRRLPVAYLLYLAGIYYFLLAAPVQGTPEVIPAACRYLIAAVPIFLQIAYWGESHPRWFALGLTVSVAVQAVFAYLFLRGLLIS